VTVDESFINEFWSSGLDSDRPGKGSVSIFMNTGIEHTAPI